MLTRRENLLIRPWQERRYIHHRLKVKSALPAIDTTPPPFRVHVSRKLKKYQKESERCAQIISDNFTLLQHLSTIMTTTRVDHFWDEPPPNFLQRVGIYASGTPKRVGSSAGVLLTDEELDQPKSRKERCAACSPQRCLRNTIVFDERRPYTPPKQKISKRMDTPVDWQSQLRCDEDKIEFRGNKWPAPSKKKSPSPGPVARAKDLKPSQKRRKKKSPKIIRQQPSTTFATSDTNSPLQNSDEDNRNAGSLVLSQGDLVVAVKFPPRTGIVYRSSTDSQRILKQTFCECDSFRRAKKTIK